MPVAQEVPLTSGEEQIINGAYEKLSEEIAKNRRFAAVVHVGGHQYKVTAGDLIATKAYADELDVGEVVHFDKVLMVMSKNTTLIGRPLLQPETVKVTACVIEKTLTHPVLSFQFHRRRFMYA